MSEIKVNSIKGVGASAAAITVNNSDGTCTANITNNLSNRNKVINGSMICSQRGTSETGVNSSGYKNAPDRWSHQITGIDAAFTVSQSTDTPDGFSNSYKIDITTADTSLANTHVHFFRQKIEGQNLQDFAFGTSSAKQLTVSFYVKTNKTGTYICELFNLGGSKQVSKTYTVSNTNWNRYTLTFPADTSTAITNDNGNRFHIAFWLSAGSDYTSGTLNSSAFATSVQANRAVGQVNLHDSTSNEWYLTGVQLEVGSVATDFEHRSFAQELALCQRYFERINVDSSEIYFFGVNQFGSGGRITHDFKVTKRAIPTMTIDDADYRYYAVAGSASNGNADFSVASYNKERMQVGSNSAGASTSFWANKVNDGYIDANSEL